MDKNLFFYELEGRGYTFENMTWLGNCFEDDMLNMAWEMWSSAKHSVKAQAVPEWISVEDEFPKKNLKVLLNLVTRKNGKPIKCIGFYSIEPDEEPCFVLDDNFTELKGVTHWVRLPDSPKAQEQSHD